MRIKNFIKTLLAGAAISTLFAFPAAASYGNVTADVLTVRTAPSIDSVAVGFLSWGDSVHITYDAGNGWYEIYYNDDCYYVDSNFVFSAALSGYTPSYASYDLDTDYDYNYDYDYDYNDYSYDYEDSSENYVYDYTTDEYSYDATYTEDTTVAYEEETPEVQQEQYSNQKYLGNFTLTAYCGCASCCGSAGNLTASGTVPTAGRTVAMGGVPFGTKLLINGNVYTVEDRGTSYGMVDIFFNSHSDAIAFGMQSADVYQID